MIKTPWPIFSNPPFKKVKLDKQLLFDILLEYNKCRFNEICDESYYEGQYDAFACEGSISMLNSERPFTLASFIHEEKFRDWNKYLQPIVEEWSGKELRFQTAFGVRSYQKDSMDTQHRIFLI